MKFFNTILLPSLLGIVLGLALLTVCRTWVEVSDAPSRTLEKRFELEVRALKFQEEYIKNQRGGGTIGSDYEG